MSKLTLQSSEHGNDKLHEAGDYGLMCSHAKALRYMVDRAIGLRNPTWASAWMKEHAARNALK